MTLRHQPHYASDGESLQADVMRFMAIIAFCLIAVLALVRDVQPPLVPVQPEAQPEVVVTEPLMPEPEQVVAFAPEPAAKAIEPQAQPKPMAPAPLSTPVPRPAPRQVPVADMASKVEPGTVESNAGESAIEAQAQAQAQAQAEAPQKKGLSLRFASDRDFLRLVTRGEIQVFAYQATSVLGLDRNFEFLTADSPGEVYELLPETIPSLIFAALDRATPESGSYTWGIRMPRKLEGKIRGFIDREVRGELVIDRYGEVHHVAS